MDEDNDILGRMLAEDHRLDENDPVTRYKRAGIEFNPFPKSGTANIVSNDAYIHKMGPVDPSVMDGVKKYILDSLYSTDRNINDKFLSGVVVGDYGSGKTQLLMYVRYILCQAVNHKHNYRNPYVIYIDNPGIKLSELIGNIISKIGEENFRKYLWSNIIESIGSGDSYKEKLKRFKPSVSLFEGPYGGDPYSVNYTVSYKLFLENWISGLPKQKQRTELKDTLKEIILEALVARFKDPVVADYFYDIISSDYSSNKTWEVLSSGSSARLDGKYVEIINAVVALIKDEGYTHFFILVDEFEDITQGRLSKSQVDNYFYNLRTLLDQQRQWCLLFAMTGNALEMLKKVSPPLADRIATRRINIPTLNEGDAHKVIINYLNMARDYSLDTTPFTEAGLKSALEASNYMTRVFLRSCYELVERFVSNAENTSIDEAFVLKTLTK